MIYYIYPDYTFEEGYDNRCCGEKHLKELVKEGKATTYDNMVDVEIAFNNGYISDYGLIRTFEDEYEVIRNVKESIRKNILDLIFKLSINNEVNADKYAIENDCDRYTIYVEDRDGLKILPSYITKIWSKGTKIYVNTLEYECDEEYTDIEVEELSDLISVWENLKEIKEVEK